MSRRKVNGMLKLPKLLSDGCVLQQDMPTRIRGWASPEATVTCGLCGRQETCVADTDGAWSVVFERLQVGGPFRMLVAADDGETIERTVYVGEVFVCSGQSNMELPMGWVLPDYPDEAVRESDPLLRQCKVMPDYDATGPKADHADASWSPCDAEHLGGFGAIGYFFGRRIRERFDVPVGLIDVSLGGAPIESWMDRKTLEAFPEDLAALTPYLGEGVAERRSADSIAARDAWYRNLGYVGAPDSHNPLPLGGWPCPERKAGPSAAADDDATAVILPGRYAKADGRLADFRGEIELTRTIRLPEHVDGKPGLLRLGTMNDADHTWVNGRLVGGRSNLYEPRDYRVPVGVLKAGDNEIRIRLVCERLGGGLTEGKMMTLSVGGESFDLSGAWCCRIVNPAHDDCPFEDFVRWKPTVLYNAMLAPCLGYAVRAVLWYQGESNTGPQRVRYADQLEAMIGLWRRGWGLPRLPFLIVGLPEAPDGYDEDGWRAVREAQRLVACDVPDAAMVDTVGLGDRYDLHPARKKPVADLLYRAALELVYGFAEEPQPK